jgi:hypothetical protein
MGNTVTNNRARRNVVNDLFDGSKGTGTVGTANTWMGNRAATTDPVGLAARPSHGKHNDGDGHDGDRDD